MPYSAAHSYLEKRPQHRRRAIAGRSLMIALAVVALAWFGLHLSRTLVVPDAAAGLAPISLPPVEIAAPKPDASAGADEFEPNELERRYMGQPVGY
ncbi:MAG TPA: hypothetical protein VFR86_15075 [Burkholderiaceae bacterium]|nr:hypothetical protein [Burkholderiaceae bacterium]